MLREALAATKTRDKEERKKEGTLPASGRPELSQWNSRQLGELVSKVERDTENVKKDLG